MHNLIRNSEEARAPARVQVTIKARELLDRDQRMLEISVSDDGPGLPAELAERVFEPYVSSKPKGTGLGLAIVKRIVEEHGGNIRIDSATGEGARFKIRLPI
jgi:signal transduction histidine kinase